MQFLLSENSLTVKKTSRKGSVALKVTPSENILLVPKWMTKQQIHQLIDTQHDWLIAKIEAQQASLPETVCLLKTDEISLFDHSVGLQWEKQHNRQRSHFQFDGQQLTVFLPVTEDSFQTEKLLKKVLARFYGQQLELVLLEMVSVWEKRIGVSVSETKVKDYKARWGSCYADGRIQFNWRLAMAPLPVVEYVVIHELCHLIHQNHSKQYWQLVAHHCAEYQTHKSWLKQQGAALIHF